MEVCLMTLSPVLRYWHLISHSLREAQVDVSHSDTCSESTTRTHITSLPTHTSAWVQGNICTACWSVRSACRVQACSSMQTTDQNAPFRDKLAVPRALARTCLQWVRQLCHHSTPGVDYQRVTIALPTLVVLASLGRSDLQHARKGRRQ